MFEEHVWLSRNDECLCPCDTQVACNVFPRVKKIAILPDQYIMLRSDCHILRLIKTVSSTFI